MQYRRTETRRRAAATFPMGAPTAANPPDERTPFNPARFPDQQAAAPFSLPERPAAPILERETTGVAADAVPPRRRGRPRKSPASQPLAPAGPFLGKVGYDPNPTVIENPPECDESTAGTLPTAADRAEPDGRSTRKRALPETGAYPSPTGNPAVGTVGARSARRRQPASVGTPEETPDRSGVRPLPERMFTPSRATEIEATPLPDYPLAHDGDEPIANAGNASDLQGVSSKTADFDIASENGTKTRENKTDSAGNLHSVSSKNRFSEDLAGEDFDLTDEAMNLRTVSQKSGKKRENDPQSFRLPSRSVTNGVDAPVKRRQPPFPEAPVKPARQDEAEPDDRDRKRPERSGDRDGRNRKNDRRYYNDGALCGWISDPEYGNASMGNEREQFHCISIIGQIEGHCLLPEGQKATKYEHIIPTLVSVEEDDRVDGLLVILNTMGGDVEAGLAIAEMIASMTKPTVSLVLGGGHSIGVPLATAAKYSLIVPSATMTIHPVRVSGMVIGVPQSFRYMSEMQERITQFICSHSRAKAEDIRELMMRPDQIATDCGSILEGSEAVRYGIIDEVGGLDRALAVLREMCAEKTEKKE